MTVISFQERATSRRQAQETAREVSRERLENIKADHALVAVMPVERASPASVQPRPTAFLAHLVATRDHAPQTRERCRAEPSEAVNAYCAALSRTPANSAQLSREI